MPEPSNGSPSSASEAGSDGPAASLFPHLEPPPANTPKPVPSRSGSGEGLKTVVIRRSSKLDGLFKGFRRFRGISYVATPALVLEFVTDHPMEDMELILGENLTPSFREEASKNRAIIEQLTDLLNQGKLRILVPKGNLIIHSKLYFLDNGDDIIRFISTSSNLTRTGVSGAQVNHGIYGDLASDDPFLKQLQEDYQQHLELCEPFLGDLMDLIRKEGDKVRAIDAWLAGGIPEAEVQRNRLVADVLNRSLQALESGTSTTVQLELPQNGDAARHLQKHLIEPSKGRQVEGRTYVIDAAAVAGHFQKNLSGMPLMRMDAPAGRLILWADGRIHERALAPRNAAEVSQGLAHVERYVGSVQFGKTADPDMARAAIWEALLSLLSAPFAHEEMKAIRERYSTEVVSRGPAILCIHGPSHNGKTTILKFALKMICGFPVQPLPGNQFTPARVRSSTGLGNLFPLIFDDIPTAGGQALESIVKSYWEQGWSREVPHPQLVITTNREAFKTWAKTRMKKLAFDIEYARNDRGTRALSELFREPTDLFPWFAHEYMASLARAEEVDLLEDPINRSRRIIARLYEFAGRPIPDGFPTRAFDRIYDHEKSRWRDLLRLKKARIVRRSGELCVEFDSGFQSHEVVEYHQMLPQGIKVRRHANLLQIESPSEFEEWIGREFIPRSFWTRLMGKLPFGSPAARNGGR